MDEKLIDSLLKVYFKTKFENVTYEEKEYEHNGIWKGFFTNENELVLGKPMDDEGWTWYSSGEYFSSGPKIVGITWNEFFSAMERFMEKEYPLVYISKIM